MNVLIQYGLEVADRAVVHDLSPVGRVLPGPLSSDQSRRLREVEQCPETPGDPGGGVTGSERRSLPRTRGACEGSQGARRGAGYRSPGENLCQIRRWSSEVRRSAGSIVDEPPRFPDMVHPAGAFVVILRRAVPPDRKVLTAEPLSGRLAMPVKIEKDRGCPVPTLVLAGGV